MPGAGPGKTPGLNLALLGGKLAQQLNVFVVNPGDPVGTEETLSDNMFPSLFARLLAALRFCRSPCHLLSSL